MQDAPQSVAMWGQRGPGLDQDSLRCLLQNKPDHVFGLWGDTSHQSTERESEPQ